MEHEPPLLSNERHIKEVGTYAGLFENGDQPEWEWIGAFPECKMNMHVRCANVIGKRESKSIRNRLATHRMENKCFFGIHSYSCLLVRASISCRSELFIGFGTMEIDTFPYNIRIVELKGCYFRCV